MGEEIAFENGRISEFQELVTLTLDRVILHTVMHQSSTCTYIPNFNEIEETFCGRTDVRSYGRTDGHLRPALLCGLGGVDLNMHLAHASSLCKYLAFINKQNLRLRLQTVKISDDCVILIQIF